MIVEHRKGTSRRVEAARAREVAYGSIRGRHLRLPPNANGLCGNLLEVAGQGVAVHNYSRFVGTPQPAVREETSMSNMGTDDPFRTPQYPNTPQQGQGQGDVTGGLIPYKNTPALIAYYLGIFALIPCFGILLAIPALILGIIGLQKRAQNPAIKGAAHAWIGIVLGGVCTLLWGGLILMGLLGGALGLSSR